MKLNRLGLFALTSFLGMAGAFAGEMGFKFQEERTGGLQFRLVGQDLCDSSNSPGSFSIDIGNISNDRRFIRNEQYISANGNSNWKVSNACRVNQELRQNLLQPGRALMVQTYGSYGQNLERFYLVVPCYKDSNFIIQEYKMFTSITQVTATVCEADGSDVAVVKDPQQSDTVVITQPTVQPPVQPAQPVQSCDSALEVSASNRNLLDVKVRCSLRDMITAIVAEKGSSNVYTLPDRVIEANTTTRIGSISRDASRSVRYDLEVQSLYHSGSFRAAAKLIAKDATYNYDVEMTLLSPKTVAATESKWLVGSGSDFSTTLRLHVADRDIEESYKTRSILVQLIETTNGRNSILEERRVSTDEALSFTLDGQYDVPYLWGNATWDESYVLRGGLNTFVIRVFDAYSSNRYKDSETIRVQLPNL